MKDLFFAIVVAAGSGSRMNSDINKQFLELSGVPVVIRTLLAFDNSPLIDGIIAVTRDFERKELIRLCKEHKIRKLICIVPGGISRQASVRNGLNFLDDFLKSNSDKHQFTEKSSYVLIHDGARPFVDNKIIESSVDCVKEHKACGVGVMVKDTIKEVSSDGTILKTVPRDFLRAIQTPQSFYFPLIKKLHDAALVDGIEFSDDTALAEHYGMKTVMIDGSYKNIKITTQEDLILGEILANSIL